ncbi:MAG: small multi-drug export protein [Oscillospiraceae bacterium]|nr:small multi-drug export protein [Oscillospiraceae bacterium]
MEIEQWLTDTNFGHMIFTVLVSMLPVVELRGGVPFGTALGLHPVVALLCALVGNMIPVPFIVVYIRRIFAWICKKIPKLGNLVARLERKAHAKGRTVNRYKYLGLLILVAIPLPGTGAWTGALVAAFLDMPLRKAIPTIFCGVLIAGVIITFLTGAVTSVLA